MDIVPLFCLYTFFNVMLGLEHSVSRVLGKCYTTKPQPQPLLWGFSKGKKAMDLSVKFGKGNMWFGTQPRRNPQACTNVHINSNSETWTGPCGGGLWGYWGRTKKLSQELERGGFRTNTTNYYSEKQVEVKWNMLPLKAMQYRLKIETGSNIALDKFKTYESTIELSFGIEKLGTLDTWQRTAAPAYQTSCCHSQNGSHYCWFPCLLSARHLLRILHTLSYLILTGTLCWALLFPFQERGNWIFTNLLGWLLSSLNPCSPHLILSLPWCCQHIRRQISSWTQGG